MGIYSQGIQIEFDIGNCAMLIIRNGKRQDTEEIEQLIEKKIRTLGEKETYKHLFLLEVDTNKQSSWKKKSKKSISGEREMFTKPNSLAGNLSKR